MGSVKNRSTLTLLAFVLPIAVFAAKGPVETNQQSLSKIYSTIKQKSGDISRLQKDITRLESNLGVSNKKYLKVVAKKKEIEAKIFDYSQELNAEQIELEDKISKSKRVLSGLLVNKFSADESLTGLAGQKILIEELATEIKRLQSSLEKIKAQKQEVYELEVRLTEYKNLENELVNLLSSLEFQKKDKAEKYLSAVGDKDRLQASYDKLRSKKLRLMSKKGMIDLGINFSAPLDSYIGLEFDKKGVTYKYKGSRPVLSTASGKIMYQGTLSNFGNVVMIDHGKETRSIILGKFVPKVSKGAEVKAGDVLGYTRDSRNQEEKLYFEVRKKNKVQNTILLLERKSVAKNEVNADNT
ncbi:MAG: hypothetical protein EP326_14720 [Deltaproteobacteria bacterium]|jgi:murein DD-endopeptidase MepM/ murein hydrolase activator NlpD|nr:MAG: hypothetical protein EP326_14720 [Deltaproteobacteria bacterium]TNF25680.1 MAG: hypothetical protein EP319_15680 [Deltaproteobacteria bacterium]